MSRYVRSELVDIESRHGDEVVLVHRRLGNRLRLNEKAYRFLQLFEQPRRLEDLAEGGAVEKALPAFRGLCRASFLVEEGHPETLSDKLVQRPRVGLLGCPPRGGHDRPPDVVFLGAPLDSGSHRGPGARYGPSSLRDLSLAGYRHYRLDPGTNRPGSWYDNDLGRTILEGVVCEDMGDLFIPPNESPAVVFAKLQRAVEEILEVGALPLVLGGDHSITYPVLRAHREPLTVIQLDAHTDQADYYDGAEHHHGNFMSRALQMDNVQEVHQIGVRGTTRHPQAALHPKVSQVLSPRKLREMGVPGVLATLPTGRSYYLTVDLDVLDPAVAPGTRTPLPGGLGFDELKELLVAIAENRRIVGFDLVELDPERDPTGLTGVVGLELLLAFLGARFPCAGGGG